MEFSNLAPQQLLKKEGFSCKCGRHHKTDLKYLEIEQGAINSLVKILKKCAVKKPFIVCDKNTYEAAGENAISLLEESGYPYGLYIFPQEKVVPDEYSVGQVVMSFEPSCDFIIAVGSGVVNDICKLLAKVSGHDYLIIGTAPSMDGFASNSSSMIFNGIKTTIYTPCPIAIIADIDIMRNAPYIMLQAGLGDMIAKYISICEWRISNLINGEYYCPEIAQLMRKALNKCVEGASGLKERNPESVKNVLEGLILSGIAMSFAKISRPASGQEHYFSHMFDIFALEKGTSHSLHGIQVGIGTVLTLSMYDELRNLKPNRSKALDFVDRFNEESWEKEMHRIFGSIGDNIIALEKELGKNDKQKHKQRLNIIIDKWDEILSIIGEELPSSQKIIDLLDYLDAPIYPSDIGINNDLVYDALIGSREIRDKYILSSLLWDLGLLQDYADKLVSD